MMLTPKQKQALSGLTVAVLGAAAAEQALSNPPFTLRSLLMSAGIGALLGLVHYIPTLGTKAAVEAKAQAIATEAVSREV